MSMREEEHTLFLGCEVHEGPNMPAPNTNPNPSVSKKKKKTANDRAKKLNPPNST
jgi:hypothetical protein